MNQHIRQRVVGIIVLLLAAGILLPVILDGGGVEQRDLERRIPPEPAAPAVPEANPDRPAITADSDDIRVPEPEAPGPLEPEAGVPETTDAEPGETADPALAQTPRLDERGLPEAWSIQLGAFSNQSNVENLVGRLLDAGHPAYTRRLNSSQGELTGVFVGPKVDQATARNVQQELEQEFELSGRVVRYQIEEQ